MNYNPYQQIILVFMGVNYNLKNIGIGICTFQRPYKLKLCLNSLYEMNTPENVNISILIVDNDKACSAEKIVKQHNINEKFAVYYEVEKNKGIPYARNKILEIAKHNKITELAFIDDDEIVEKNWMVSIWNYYCTSNIDVVWGWVKTIYPENTPKWIIDGNFYQLPKYDTGKISKTAYTNNVFFNFQKLVVQQHLSFNSECGNMGEDEDFFMRAINLGNIIHFCSETIVYEILDESRFTKKYFLKRLFFTKNNKNLLQNQHFTIRLSILKSGIYDIIRSIFKFIDFIIYPKEYKWVSCLGFLVSAIAKITASFNIYFKNF